MPDVYINAIGTAVPANRFPQQELYQLMEATSTFDRKDRLILRQLHKYSGIKNRHTVVENFETECREHGLFSGNGSEPSLGARMAYYEKSALPLALKAVDKCVEKLTRFNVEEITHVITFSCTGMYAPGLDIELIEQLKINNHVERTNINFMGCQATFNAMKGAFHIVRSCPGARVLLVGVELSTLHYQKTNDPEQMVANTIFSDGASAVLISGDKYLSNHQRSMRLDSFQSEIFPAGKKEMTWRIRNSGFDLRLGGYVPEIVEGGIKGLTETLFNKTELHGGEIMHYAIHPGGSKILQACEKALGLSKKDLRNSYKVLQDYGNMSSVTILFVLKLFLMEESNNVGEKLLSCAFGPGLSVESAIMEIS